MRILVIAQYFPPRRSTFAARWAWLATFLAERGHTVEVVAHMSSARQLGILRHAFQSDPPPPGVVMHPVLPVLGRQCLATVDVVVASAPPLVNVPLGWFVAKLRGRPIVLDLRDAWPELIDDWRRWNDDGQSARRLHPIKRFALPPAAALVRWALGWLRRSADAVVVSSERLGGHLRDQGLRQVAVVRNTSSKPWVRKDLTPEDLSRDFKSDLRSVAVASQPVRGRV